VRWLPRATNGPRDGDLFPAFMAFRIFPATWDWRRVMECGIAAYQACVGAVAFAHPATLSHSSYSALIGMLSAQQWGLLLWLIALMHASCIYFCGGVNGPHPFYGGILRTGACAIHMVAMLLVALAYIKVGDYYRLVTTIFLVLGVLSALSIATEDIARAVNVRRL
jgi:hypothetical protein